MIEVPGPVSATQPGRFYVYTGDMAIHTSTTQQHEAIQAMLPEGWRVRFQHERPRVMVYDPPSPPLDGSAIGMHRALALATRWVLSSHKGGHTVCVISDASGRVMSVGYAYCSPKDTYCKRTGRELAFERAAFGSPAVASFQRVAGAAKAAL